ncbi:MAG: sulfite exporter TauE/SafE family protein [Gammaproteobacteria bacterium]|nr:sulfite exporter TauE/SafE family protein [Gammaproteobacteria bacterium]MDH5650421.1 sulfite exporter TauE/SafE family protein [Gammaproteobacteria bacterium]
MDISYSHLAVFVVGFLGGVHCVGMCGGIVGVLSLGLAEEKRLQVRSNLPYLLLYNLGRIMSYTLAGAVVGGLGAVLTDLLTIRRIQLWLQVPAGLFMILLGFYLSGWWRVLVRVEEAGNLFWQRLEPYGRRILPVTRPSQALLLGMIWGWLPCGLVYSVLAMSLVSGNAGAGALLMLSFGLGTLPNLLAMGIFAAYMQQLVQKPWVRQAAGLLVILFGLYTLWQAAVSLAG